MPDKNSAKYLKNYAEDEVNHLQSFPRELSFKHVVVIPAYKESYDFIARFFSSQLAETNTLVILVINQPDEETSDKAQQQLFNSIIDKTEQTWQHGNLTLAHFINADSQLLIVDRFTRPIPIKQGVGLARKIGADIALALIEQGAIKSEWIYSTDADVTLPDNYFDAEQLILNPNEYSAGCFEFSHSSQDVKLHQANQRYETALRYYVAGLAFAGSAYAYFTIGSIILFNRKHYAQVRGFPKRSAGEDFYLLNKLAKLAPIKNIENITLTIAARPSDRVPFGTGPAVSQILAQQESGEDYCYYHPALFDCLKVCLAAFDDLWPYLAVDKIEQWSKVQDKKIVIALDEIGFNTFIAQQNNLPNTEKGKQQFYKQLHVWFDSFKTLKFIHALREANYPNVPLTQALKDASFTTVVGDY